MEQFEFWHVAGWREWPAQADVSLLFHGRLSGRKNSVCSGCWILGCLWESVHTCPTFHIAGGGGMCKCLYDTLTHKGVAQWCVHYGFICCFMFWYIEMLVWLLTEVWYTHYKNCFLSVGVEPWIMSSHTLLWTASQPSHLQVAATQLINMDETIECAHCKAGEWPLRGRSEPGRDLRKGGPRKMAEDRCWCLSKTWPRAADKSVRGVGIGWWAVLGTERAVLPPIRLLSWKSWNSSEFMNHSDLRPLRPKDHLPYLSRSLEEEEQMSWEGSLTLPWTRLSLPVDRPLHPSPEPAWLPLLHIHLGNWKSPAHRQTRVYLQTFRSVN